MGKWTIVMIFVFGLCAITAEIFLPGAVLGIIGFLACSASVFLAYYYKYTITGHILLVLTLASIPLFFILWKTFMGKIMAIEETEEGFTAHRTELDDLVGCEGVAMSVLRPSGIAMINGKRYDVVTRGVMVEKGTPVKVVEVSGNQIIVKPL